MRECKGCGVLLVADVDVPGVRAPAENREYGAMCEDCVEMLQTEVRRKFSPLHIYVRINGRCRKWYSEKALRELQSEQ